MPSQDQLSAILPALRPAAGTVVALMGASAPARTAALRALGGVTGDGGALPDADLGLLGGEPRFFPWLSLAENLAFALPKATPFEREGLIANVLVRVGLAARIAERPGALAPVELQRLAIARLLLLRPRLLLVDQPFAGLAAPSRAELAAFLPELCRLGRPAVIVATDETDEAVALADRILVLPPRPGPIAFSLDNLLPRPRDARSAGFLALRRELRHVLHKEAGHDLPAVETAA